MNIFLSIHLNICFLALKRTISFDGSFGYPQHKSDGSFEHPKQMYWLRNEKNYYYHTLFSEKATLKKTENWFSRHNYHLMQVKSIAECSKGSILQFLSTFIKLPFVIKIFVLSIFEWPFYTSFTAIYFAKISHYALMGNLKINFFFQTYLWRMGLEDTWWTISYKTYR